MNEPPADHEPQERREAGQLSEEELEEALSTLEHILRHRHVVPDSREPAAEPPGDTLPLLKNVVIPGDPPTPLPVEPPAQAADDWHESLEPAPPHDDLVVRLVNELDIIIESCVDSALAEAKQDLMVKMKNHLDIVLPEILDELERRRYEDPEDDDEPGA